MLLFVGASWSVDGEVVLNSDNPIVDHVELRRIFVAGPDDDLTSVSIDVRPDWSIDTMNLPFDPRAVPRESGKRVHVGSHLLIHEIDVLSHDVVKGFRHKELQGSNRGGAWLAASARRGRCTVSSGSSWFGPSKAWATAGFPQSLLQDGMHQAQSSSCRLRINLLGQKRLKDFTDLGWHRVWKNEPVDL